MRLYSCYSGFSFSSCKRWSISLPQLLKWSISKLQLPILTSAFTAIVVREKTETLQLQLGISLLQLQKWSISLLQLLKWSISKLQLPIFHLTSAFIAIVKGEKTETLQLQLGRIPSSAAKMVNSPSTAASVINFQTASANFSFNKCVHGNH